jgi:hypothetical protein
MKIFKRNSIMLGALYPNFQGSQEGSGLPRTNIVRSPKKKSGRRTKGGTKKGEKKTI